MSMEQVYHNLRYHLQQMGFSDLYETSLAQRVSLLKAYDEFSTKFDQDKTPKDPLLCSECPGWICYAEKVVGELVIPKMSVVKSPQQIQGIIVKKNFPGSKHVTIMPCYDKKLEAVRPPAEDQEVEVDAVLATHEISDLLKDKGIDLKLPIDSKPQEGVLGFSSFDAAVKEG